LLKACAVLCELTRPLTSSIPALLTGVVALASAKISPATALRGGLAMALTTMAGFLFDNIYDLPTDRAVGQPTPLTQGLVSISQARGLAGIFAVCAILLDPVGASGKLTLSATLLALWFYSYAAHWAPWFKNVYSALLACVPLFYGSLIAGVSVPLAYYFVLGLFVLGRESLIDAHQADADRKAGFRTLAILLGRPATSS
jgi:4-hydroxybenzoate polyprenyltransferase